MIRKINGKTKSSVTHLKTPNFEATTKDEIADELATNFFMNSSSLNYTEKFRNIQRQEEKKPINFKSKNDEEYNMPFHLTELKDSLSKANDSATGPDEIHYQMLKHLPEVSLNALLDIYNDIWKSGTFPQEWTEATVIPIPKPGKDHSNPTNYRPIALTSCVCKILERMINTRLVWYLCTMWI